MNYYEHHLGDYVRDTVHLSMLEDAAYRRLLDAYYTREKPLPADVKECWKLARAQSKQEREAVEYVLREFFFLTEEGHTQQRADREISRFKDKQEKARRSANARWSKDSEQSEGSAFEGAGDMRTHMRTHSDGNALQSPDPSNKEAKASSSGSSKRTAPNCPADELIDAYEAKLPMLPSVRRSLFKAGKNMTAMRQRWGWVMTAKHERGARAGLPLATTLEEGIEWFERFFAYAAESDFLTGKNGKWSSCDLAWLMTAAKFENVLSGKYHEVNTEAA